MHKMEPDEIQAAHDFANAAEIMLERGKFSMESAYENWHSFDDDDKDKIEILALRKRLAKEEDTDEEDIDERILAYEYLRRKYSYRTKVAIMTAEILIDNACDPTKSYLDFHPSYYQNHVEPEQ